MTKLPRREQNRLNRERQILDAALKIFGATGYTGATMDAVAAEAGVTKPTLYSYFPSKESLFQAMMLGKRDLMLDVFEHPSPEGMVQDLRRVMKLSRHNSLLKSGRISHSLEEHATIMAAFDAHDPEAARKAMHTHFVQGLNAAG